MQDGGSSKSRNSGAPSLVQGGGGGGGDGRETSLPIRPFGLCNLNLHETSRMRSPVTSLAFLKVSSVK